MDAAIALGSQDGEYEAIAIIVNLMMKRFTASGAAKVIQEGIAVDPLWPSVSGNSRRSIKRSLIS